MRRGGHRLGHRARPRLSALRPVGVRLGRAVPRDRHRGRSAGAACLRLGLADGYRLLLRAAALAELYILGVQRDPVAPRLRAHGRLGRLLRSVRRPLCRRSGLAGRPPLARLGPRPGTVHLGRRGVGAGTLPGRVPVGTARVFAVPRPAGDPDRGTRRRVCGLVRAGLRELCHRGGVRDAVAPCHAGSGGGSGPRECDPGLRSDAARGGRPGACRGDADRPHAALHRATPQVRSRAMPRGPWRSTSS